MCLPSFVSARACLYRLAALALLGGCQDAPVAQNCPSRGSLVTPRDTFDFVALTDRKGFSFEVDSLRLPFVHQQRLLRGAYFIGGMLTQDSTALNTRGSAYYVGQVRSLMHSPRTSCHQVVYADADEFGGLFLVIGYPDRPANLYLSGSVGSSYTDGGYFHMYDVTQGFVLNDSTVLTKTGRSSYAYRGTKQVSYTDSIFQLYRIDHRATRFVLLHRDSVRTNLPDEFWPE